jgi:hypothetical protein
MLHSGLGLNGDSAPVVPSDDGLDDDVEERIAKTMVWTAKLGGPCNCDETQLELGKRR